MDIIFSASIVAAFFAGMVALFAPCCITVLLPAYIASAFKEKRNIGKMTLLFFLGIAVVLVPIGLGAAGLAEVFQRYHRELYFVGGALMLGFAVLAVSGKSITLIPMSKRLTPRMDGSNPKAVFVLGIFSGAATSCCAPVLAGAVTLAVISGAFWKALIVTFAYVFGMTIPLFIAAYVYDKYKIEQSAFIKGRLFEWKFGSKKIYVHSTNLVSGAIFLVMSAILFAIALSGTTFWAPELQVSIGEWLNSASQRVLSGISIVPESIWGILIIGLFGFFAYTAYAKEKTSRINHGNSEQQGDGTAEGSAGEHCDSCKHSEASD